MPTDYIYENNHAKTKKKEIRTTQVGIETGERMHILILLNIQFLSHAKCLHQVWNVTFGPQGIYSLKRF